MTRQARFIFGYWLPVVAMMVLIFAASGDRSSARHSSRIIGPVVHWLFPSWTAAEVDRAVFHVRKLAHVTEYAVLAMLLWRAFTPRAETEPGSRWSWRRASLAFAVAVLYAVSDEVHQSFVPSRIGTPQDVLIDSCGAFLGLLFIWLWGVCRRKWRHRATASPDPS